MPLGDRVSRDKAMIRRRRSAACFVQSARRILSEAEGTYTWATEFGFWVLRDTLSVRSVRWVENYAAVNAP
jgi:hypothetical protein